MGGSIQFVARSGDGARVPRRNAAGRRGQGRALLLDVRAEILQHGADAAGQGVCGKGDGREVGRVSEKRRSICEDLNRVPNSHENTKTRNTFISCFRAFVATLLKGPGRSE